jgi:DNA-binding beta-propeller fold protein YncE
VGQELSIRNEEIYVKFASGTVSRYELAREYGLTPRNVSEIVSKYAVPASEEDARNGERVLLEATRDRLMKEVVYGPRQIAVSPAGQPVYDNNGNPVYESRDLVSAIDTVRKLSESIRKLDALDLPRKKEISQDEALTRIREYLAKLPQAVVVNEDGGDTTTISGQLAD